jgi:hypothetical protein
MLTHREPGWSIIRESLRRERRIHDLLASSSVARLTKRVAVTGLHDEDWRTTEQELRLIEHDIRRLDPSSADFWSHYEEQELRLLQRFAAAGIELALPASALAMNVGEVQDAPRDVIWPS